MGLNLVSRSPSGGATYYRGKFIALSVLRLGGQNFVCTHPVLKIAVAHKLIIHIHSKLYYNTFWCAFKFIKLLITKVSVNSGLDVVTICLVSIHVHTMLMLPTHGFLPALQRSYNTHIYIVLFLNKTNKNHPPLSILPIAIVFLTVGCFVKNHHEMTKM